MAPYIDIGVPSPVLSLLMVVAAMMFAVYLYTPISSAFNVIKSVLGRVHSSCMLVLRLCSVMVASQHVVDTRQMLYKYMIL